MRNLPLTLLAALATSVIAAAPASADENAVAISVAIGSLDLSNPADAARLRSRLGRAAAAACVAPGTRGVHAYAAFGACRTQAMSAARLQADRAVASAQRPGGAARVARR